MGKIVTDYWAKPIPIRSFDWMAWIDGEEEHGPIGEGATEAEARADLLDQIEDMLEQRLAKAGG